MKLIWVKQTDKGDDGKPETFHYADVLLALPPMTPALEKDAAARHTAFDDRLVLTLYVANNVPAVCNAKGKEIWRGTQQFALVRAQTEARLQAQRLLRACADALTE